MPSAPLRYCSYQGCTTLVASGACLAHAHQQRQHQTRFQQGLYGRPWRRLRNRYLATHPFCVECRKLGILRVADEVDHIIPHRGDLELARDPANFQSLCKSHHSAKTAAESGWLGGG